MSKSYSNQKYKIFLISLVVVPFLIVTVTNSSLSQEEVTCNKNIKVIENDWLRYKKRGNRCEGRYVQELASTGAFRLIGYFNIDPDLVFSKNDEVIISWSALEAPVKIEANSVLSPNIPYRMDAIVKNNETTFKLPLWIIKSLGLNRDDVVFLAKTNFKLEYPDSTIFLPIVIKSSKDNDVFGIFKIVIAPSRQYKKITVAFKRLNDLNTNLYQKSLAQTYFPPNRPIYIPFELDNINEPILFEVLGEYEGGGSYFDAIILPPKHDRSY